MMNKKVLFNDGWEFAKSSLDVSEPLDLQFTPVDVPHDWLVYNTQDLYEDSIGWYRKTFNWDHVHDQVLLYFEGIYMNSSVYVNQRLVGEWKNGYSSFEHDITRALVPGENEITVKVVHQAPNSRWYSGAGIYRNVWLKLRDRNHIASDGIYVSIRKETEAWRIEIDSEIEHDKSVLLTHYIKSGDQIVTQSTAEIAAENQEIDMQTMYVEDPLLWDTKQPNLYQLETKLQVVEDKELVTVEKVVQNIGFREIVLDPEQGFSLNGNKMKLNGVCEHHDFGSLGAAFNLVALRRKFVLLQEMGVNAIRTSHNMPAPQLMDLADEMGILVVSEAFDMWEKQKTRYDYGRFFPKWAERDVRSWVRRDRNHPSLIMWSIGNEIYDTHADGRGQEITKMLRDYVRESDYKENAPVTIGSNYMAWESAQKCADILKLVGYNYAERLYDEHHLQYPDWIIYGSETSSVVQSRGVYHFPFEQAILVDEDEQCSSLGNSTVSWGAKSTEYCIIAERDTPFSLGQFLWTGFDYIGEPTPYRTKNSYFGQLDTATFKKDVFYMWQSAWTDYKTAPMVHVFPYWDFNPGQIIDVRVCSNAPRIELQLNNKTIGTFDIDHQNGDQLFGSWKVPYEAGELKAIAYDETGQVIATDIRNSFGDSKEICLQADKTQLVANGIDLIYVEISTKDVNGNPVENANDRVQVSVTGAGRLVGLDNGDSTDYDQYKGVSRRLFNGKLMAIIAATLEPGDIQVQISGEELLAANLSLTAVPANTILDGISFQTQNEPVPCIMGPESEIPVRKIELLCDQARVLDASKPELVVRAEIYPQNASYRDLEWSVVNDVGFPSPVASVSVDANIATVTALGDGDFRLRCTSNNGSDKPKLISQLEFKATGVGVAYKDPYQLVSASLYDYSSGQISTGNERGIATGYDETQLGFYNLDFGVDGSDTITLTLYTPNADAYPLQIWQGKPGAQDSVLLADLIYQKPFKWNVYKTETYQLDRRLRSVADLYVVTHHKLHIKGFQFTSSNRSLSKIHAGECERIYGDAYTKQDHYVTGIGNNVSLEFTALDFEKAGVSQLIVCGKTPLEVNTIHVQFRDGEQESRQILEFTKTNAYQEQSFTLDQVTGKQNVTFIFLPGSDFDFAWFRFK